MVHPRPHFIFPPFSCIPLPTPVPGQRPEASRDLWNFACSQTRPTASSPAGRTHRARDTSRNPPWHPSSRPTLNRRSTSRARPSSRPIPQLLLRPRTGNSARLPRLRRNNSTMPSTLSRAPVVLLSAPTQTQTRRQGDGACGPAPSSHRRPASAHTARPTTPRTSRANRHDKRPKTSDGPPSYVRPCHSLANSSTKPERRRITSLPKPDKFNARATRRAIRPEHTSSRPKRRHRNSGSKSPPPRHPTLGKRSPSDWALETRHVRPPEMQHD
ncbi:uncharacterized protein C8Q71DRAFT_449868 [Rhodofomes roseus]|uniref:Uncharacterized protein n=1 Tax=Rhodofomes roseus TaxID=34475 RepID=A0ABQ8JXZ9_9APHY|nr:uncharacterized protein C8Q71DRAFT_449868 [Rhodofomes roseus]KAH9829117.1 hypothetical protein C8Q71DRAFT_449868 [Rhodofomes roseus]